MGAASLHFKADALALRSFWRSIRNPEEGRSECAHRQTIWRRALSKEPGVLLEGKRYCVARCLEPAIGEIVLRVRSSAPASRAAHRIPLGLLLVSRRQLTPEQLRVALETQSREGRGRLGDWLLSLGYVDEQQITAALARQWSCPVLRDHSSYPRSTRIPQIPFTLLESFDFMPVDYVVATQTLHVAFAKGIDYNLLYALEKMIGCRTEACMAVPSFIHRNLGEWMGRREHELSFAQVSNSADLVRILRSYGGRVSASEIKVASCGDWLWARLFRLSRPSLDLLFRLSPVVSRPRRDLA